MDQQWGSFGDRDDESIKKQQAGWRKHGWLHFETQAFYSRHFGTCIHYHCRDAGSLYIHLLYGTGCGMSSVGSGYPLWTQGTFVCGRCVISAGLLFNTGLYRSFSLGGKRQSDALCERDAAGGLRAVQPSFLSEKVRTDGRNRDGCHNRMPVRELCQSKHSAFCFKNFLKNFFYSFFQDIVDIKSYTDDMLCLDLKMAQMPINSRKNPFAFLKKSDYNGTQTGF